MFVSPSIGSGHKCRTERFTIPAVVWILASLETPSFPWERCRILPRGHLHGGWLQCLMSTRVPVVNNGFAGSFHLYCICSWEIYSRLKRVQNCWYIRWMSWSRDNLFDGVVTRSVSGSKVIGRPIKKCEGVRGSRSFGLGIKGARI